MKQLTLTIICIFAITLAKSQDEATKIKPATDTLTIGYYVSPPFVEYENNQLGGISFWLWMKIADEIKQPYKMQRMQLSEVVAGLSDGSIDMTINPLTITSKRGQIFDFSAPYFISKSGIMTESISAFEKWSSFFLSFFSINFLRAVLALFLVLLIFGTFVWIFEHRANPDEFEKGVKGLWSGIWWSAVTMTTVGYGDKSPKSVGGRIVALIWMFAAIIMISGFTASIASSLTVNQLGWSKSQIDDYKNQKIATVKRSATEHFLKKRFFKNIVSYGSLEECVGALGRGKVIGVAYDVPQLTHIVRSDTTERFELLKIQYNSQLYAFGFSESLQEAKKENITNELLKIVESLDYKIVLGEHGLIED